jgi:biopolymer transport protein ExbB
VKAIYVLIISIVLNLCFNAGLYAEPKNSSLDGLLEAVRQEGAAGRELNKSREARFLEEKSRQQQLLKDAKDALLKEKQRSESLTKNFDDNEKQLSELEELLHQRTGSLGELFGVVRQVAGDTTATLEHSLVSAQIGGRTDIVRRLSKSKALPSIDELESLWFALQQEMTESGKIVRFPGKIVTAEGKDTEAMITRVGVFNAVSDGSFLRYLPETGQLVELPRQPAARYQRMASALENAESGLTAMAIDPSRGAILALFVDMPDIVERITQGKLVGYIIIAIAVIGLAMVAERGFTLTNVERKIKQQLASDTPNEGNPLGRIMSVYFSNQSIDTETLERKIDEAILKEAPMLERGLPTIKILAVIAPLLGLLGTVTGMIETFQSITLFGTGDPKLMAGGISQALITTALGLVAAIPLIMLHSITVSKSRRCINILEEQSAGIIALHAEKMNA